MTDLVLFEVLGTPCAATLDEFETMKARARERSLQNKCHDLTTLDDRIVTAEQAEQLTSVPATWFAEAMRKGTIPHLKFGKYPRMRFSEVLAAVESRPKSAAAQAVTPLKSVAGQGHGRGR